LFKTVDLLVSAMDASSRLEGQYVTSRGACSLWYSDPEEVAESSALESDERLLSSMVEEGGAPLAKGEESEGSSDEEDVDSEATEDLNSEQEALLLLGEGEDTDYDDVGFN
jgi:hypothetical protein